MLRLSRSVNWRSMGHPGSGIPRCGHGLRACGWPGRWSLVLLGDEPDTARGKRWFWNGCSTGSGTVALWHETKQCFASVILCAVDPVRWVPRNNVIFVGLVALLGAFLLSYSLATEMLNFGALLAFIGVNAAAFVRYFVRASAKRLANLVLPISGLTICLLLWLNLSRAAMLAGVLWMAVGIAFGAWKTRGFRMDLINFEIPSGAEI